MKTPHPLKEIINAIADGIEVEISCKGHLDWIMWNKDMISPLDSRAFYYEYRIKPEPAPTPEQLAALGWQSIECPFCGTSGAQAFPKPECDWEGIAADQAMTIALLKSEQPEQEPWCMKMNGCKTKCEDCPDEAAKPEQEPVGQLCEEAYGRYQVAWFREVKDGAKLYTAPPKREWVGLTAEERNAIEAVTLGLHGIPSFFATAIEAKLKELNHG